MRSSKQLTLKEYFEDIDSDFVGIEKVVSNLICLTSEKITYSIVPLPIDPRYNIRI